MSEDSVGDGDIILTISAASNDTRINEESNSNAILMRLLNHNTISEAAETMDDIVGCSPRWLLFGKAINPDDFS